MSVHETALESLADGIVVADADGRVVLTNAAARRLLGADPAAIPATDWCQGMGLCGPDGAPFVPGESPLHRALRGESIADAEMLVRGPGGSADTRVAVSGAVLPDGAVGTMAVLLDLSRHAAALASRELFLEAIVENIPDMIFVKDARELRFVRFNRAGEELLGYSRDELLGRNDYDFFTAQEADFFTSKDRAVLAGKAVLDIPEEPIHTRHKGVRILHTKKIPIADASGTPLYLLGISEDITERKHAERELAASQEQKAREQAARQAAEEAVHIRDEFLSIASHELRTPITALQFAMQSVLRLARERTLSKVPEETALGVLETAERQARRLAKLVETLLDVSRIHAGRLQIAREPVDLTEIAREVAAEMRGEAERAGCTLTLRAGGPIVGLWDGPRLEQVVTNLLHNAIRYGAGKPVELQVEAVGRSARLRVIDRGIGIAADRQAQIFDRFERAASAEHYGGLGLGLYIVRSILDAFGGAISVESEVDRGSTFIVDLPLDLRPHTPAPAQPS